MLNFLLIYLKYTIPQLPTQILYIFPQNASGLTSFHPQNIAASLSIPFIPYSTSNTSLDSNQQLHFNVEFRIYERTPFPIRNRFRRILLIPRCLLIDSAATVVKSSEQNSIPFLGSQSRIRWIVAILVTRKASCGKAGSMMAGSRTYGFPELLSANRFHSSNAFARIFRIIRQHFFTEFVAIYRVVRDSWPPDFIDDLRTSFTHFRHP